MNKRIILTNVNLFDGVNDQLLEKYTLVVEDGCIKEMFPDMEKTLENGKVISLAVIR